MKTILLSIVAILFFSVNMFAQPDRISYQTVIRDASGALVSNQNVGVRITILQSTTSIYVETHTVTTNANGLASLVIGAGTSSSGSIANITWSANTSYSVRTAVDPTGGTNYTITGTSQLFSVPFALRAKTAESVENPAWLTSGNNIYKGNTGDVGIGTNNPSDRLHIKKTSSNNYLRVEAGGTGGSFTAGIKLTENGFNFGHIIEMNAGSDALLFRHNNNATTNTLMTLSANGNLGIGVTSPTHPLELTSTGVEPLKIKTAATNRAILLEPSSTTNSSWELFCGNDGLNFCERGVACNRFVLDQGGNIGIGTSSPSARLQIDGDASADALRVRISGATKLYTHSNGGTAVGSFTTPPTNGLYVSGAAQKPGGGSWTAASDKRLKDRVVPFKDGIDAILAINPVKYHYTKQLNEEIDTEKEHIGVIAQELKEVAPYMVGTFQKDGTEYYNVDNSAMTYMLINAVKEQQAQIAQQQAQIKALEKQVKALVDKQ